MERLNLLNVSIGGSGTRVNFPMILVFWVPYKTQWEETLMFISTDYLNHVN